ncbi:MAG: hypothetical protein ACE5IR_24570 [bacterium]
MNHELHEKIESLNHAQLCGILTAICENGAEYGYLRGLRRIIARLVFRRGVIPSEHILKLIEKSYQDLKEENQIEARQ